jgi:hypothetical protein
VVVPPYGDRLDFTGPDATGGVKRWRRLFSGPPLIPALIVLAIIVALRAFESVDADLACSQFSELVSVFKP